MQTVLLKTTVVFAHVKVVSQGTRMEFNARQVRFCFSFKMLGCASFISFIFIDQLRWTVPVPSPPIFEGCKSDGECPSSQACINTECQNPCKAINPCAQHAQCVVHSTLPLRTMSCVCDEGYTGKGDERCEKICKQ